MGEKQKIIEASNYIEKQSQIKPKIGIVLGSGLGVLAEVVLEKHEIPYKEIPYFPVSTVKGHKGQLVLGKYLGKEILIMHGRFHFYEGYTMKEITFPIRVMKALGVETLILTNSAGGINPLFRPGDIMIISDHINLMGDNPLRGKNDPELGPRFPSLHAAYDKKLIELAEKVSIREKIKIHKGVYVGVSGPSYETPAEIKMLKTIGADAVGMSTVPEVIVACHSGIRTMGISCITNVASMTHHKAAHHEEVIEAANKTAPKILSLIKGIITEVN